MKNNSLLPILLIALLFSSVTAIKPMIRFLSHYKTLNGMIFGVGAAIIAKEVSFIRSAWSLLGLEQRCKLSLDNTLKDFEEFKEVGRVVDMRPVYYEAFSNCVKNKNAYNLKNFNHCMKLIHKADSSKIEN